MSDYNEDYAALDGRIAALEAQLYALRSEMQRNQSMPLNNTQYALISAAMQTDGRTLEYVTNLQARQSNAIDLIVQYLSIFIDSPDTSVGSLLYNLKHWRG